MSLFYTKGDVAHKSKNYSGKDSEPKGNYGRGPTKAGQTGDSVPNTTASKGKINGGATVTKPGNADKIQVRQMPNRTGNKCC